MCGMRGKIRKEKKLEKVLLGKMPNKKLGKKPSSTKTIKTCPECGKVFETKHSWKIFCCAKCYYIIRDNQFLINKVKKKYNY